MTLPDTPLTEAQARDLLARAAEFDATLSPQSQMAELRQAALEAGIHPTAFDRAARELLASITLAKPTLWTRVRQNLLGAGLFWITLTAVVQPLIWLNVPGTGRTLGMLIASFGGIQMADRLRARLVRTALIAITAGQLVLFGFSLAGIASSGANVLTWAVLWTGAIATAATALYGYQDRKVTPATPLQSGASIQQPAGQSDDTSLAMRASPSVP